MASGNPAVPIQAGHPFMSTSDGRQSQDTPPWFILASANLTPTNPSLFPQVQIDHWQALSGNETTLEANEGRGL